MTTTWGNVNKPNGLNWSDVSKPQGTTSVITQTFTGGFPIGLLLSLTQSSITGVTSIVTSKWTDVPEHASSWTSVPKAT